MKIAEIRRVIDALHWTRNDLHGATAEEFKCMNVPARLQPHIEACRQLVIKPRFGRDHEDRTWAIERAEQMVARWKALQPAQGAAAANDSENPCRVGDAALNSNGGN